MTLEEIFKSNPQLQHEPEVQKLIAYSKEEYAKVVELFVKYMGFHDNVLEKMMHSSIVLKNGKSQKETLLEIMQLIEIL